MIPFLKIHYNNVVRQDSVLTGHPHVYTEITKPTKLLLMVRNSEGNNKAILSGVLALDCIGNQKPYLLCSGDSMLTKVVGCKITLRKKNLYNFLFNLSFRVLPKTKQFEGFRSCVESNVFSFSLREVFHFEELIPLSKLFDNLGYLHCQLHFRGRNKDMIFIGRSILLCVV